MNKEKLDKPFKISWIIAVTSLIGFVAGILCFSWNDKPVSHYFGLIFVVVSLVGLALSFFVGKFLKKT
ncbi:MAG: hypothetical protein LBJ97_02865 [Mycoplasmataceae bacterium]|jgi:nicotinamide riboside transporter PnuC|nr:hypothetical protein [Mycoplasmataceae bacterium]